MHKPKGHGAHGHAPAELNPEAVKAGHEVGDVELKPIINFLVGLSILAAVSFVVVYGSFKFLASYMAQHTKKPAALAAQGLNAVPPEPRLQVDPLKDWVVFKAEQDSVTTTYAWLDKTKGVVRLPLDRALEVMATRDWPHRPGTYAPTGHSSMAPVGGGAGSGEHAGPEGAAPSHAAPAEGGAHDAGAQNTGTTPAETPAAGNH